MDTHSIESTLPNRVDVPSTEPALLRRFTSDFGEAQEEIACPLCGRRDFTPFREARDLLFGRPGTYRVVRCAACTLAFVNPRPTFESLGAHYPDDYHCYSPPEEAPRPFRRIAMWGAREHSLQRVKRIERVLGRIQPDQQLLDVGCGLNSFLQVIRDDRGATGMGVELKDTMVERIRGKLKMPVVHGTLHSAAFDSSRFDLVTMNEYLEHEPNACGVLAEARRVLKPGGHVALEIPDIEGWPARFFKNKWANLDLPRHLIFFERRTLELALRKNGFELVSYHRFGIPLYVGLSFLFWLGHGDFGRHPITSAVMSYVVGLPTLPFLPWTPEFVVAVAKAV